MRVIDAATLKGDGTTNQDRYLIGDYYAAVLDGASAYPPQPESRDGGWYAQQLADAIEELMRPDETLEDVLASAIEAVAVTHHLRPGSSPSSTIAIARWSDTEVECLVLGDSSIVVSQSDGTREHLTDDRLSSIATVEREAYRRRLAAGHGYDDGHRALLETLQREQRRWRNVEGGYWIAEAVPAAAHRALHRQYARGRIESLVLMSDGAATPAQLMSTLPWPTVPSAVRAAGCERFLTGVFDAEAGDSAGQAYPRGKRHDDKTVLLVARR